MIRTYWSTNNGVSWYSPVPPDPGPGLEPTLGMLGVIIDGGGSVISTDDPATIVLPYNCTITQCDILADQSGDVMMSILNNDVSITGSNPPAMSGAAVAANYNISDWDKALHTGDTLSFKVDSVTDITLLVLTLHTTR